MNTKITLKLLKTAKKMVKARLGIPKGLLSGAVGSASIMPLNTEKVWVIPIKETHYESIKETFNITLGTPKKILSHMNFPHEVMVRRKDDGYEVNIPDEYKSRISEDMLKEKLDFIKKQDCFERL